MVTTTMAITAIMETMTMTMTTTITIKETMNMIMETMTMTMETMIMITRIMETIQSRFNRAGSCRFDEKKCEAGIEALGFYHEKMMWDRGDESGDSAAGFRVTLDPRQVVHIDTAQNKSIDLECGSAADTLAIVDTGKIYTAGAAE